MIEGGDAIIARAFDALRRQRHVDGIEMFDFARREIEDDLSDASALLRIGDAEGNLRMEGIGIAFVVGVFVGARSALAPSV